MAWDSLIVCGTVGVDTEEDDIDGAAMEEEGMMRNSQCMSNDNNPPVDTVSVLCYLL